MNQTPSRNEQARHFYNVAGTISTDFSFMNYGYAPLSAELSGSSEPEKYCLQLYRQLIGDTVLKGKRVVEVSCGRGGGARPCPGLWPSRRGRWPRAPARVRSGEAATGFVEAVYA